MKINLILFAIFIFIISYIGCKDSTAGIDNNLIPSSKVSYGKYIAPLFLTKCANSGCHDDATRAGGISLISWVGATEPDIVIKGDSKDSPLVWTIDRIAGIPPMPPVGSAALTTNQIAGIKTWIDEGAQNN
jgi:hypothetical protein